MRLDLCPSVFLTYKRALERFSFLSWEGFLEVHFSLAFLIVGKLNLLFGLFLNS